MKGLVAFLCACQVGSTSGDREAGKPSVADIENHGDAADAALVTPAVEAGTRAENPEGSAYESKRIRAAKPIGHTSVVYKLRFEDGSVCAFKPSSRIAPDRFRGELAAYRLARALGIGDRVPAAYAYQVELGSLRAAASDPDRITREVFAEAGMVQGALIPWIDDLTFPPLERDPGYARWLGWLRKRAEVKSAEDGQLADAMAEMVVFDFVTGNFDRFSGANIGSSAGRILFIDNDGAFLQSMPVDAAKKNENRMMQLRRPVPRLSAALSQLADFPLGLESVFGSDRRGAPLLSKSVVEGVRTRLARAIMLTRALE